MEGVPVISEEYVFDLMCLECGRMIRLSRITQSRFGALRWYADEEGYENVDFHFHAPA